jgi:hypothetical protein
MTTKVECHQETSCHADCDPCGGNTTVGWAQGTGVNQQVGLLNVNALNGNNVLNDVNAGNILSFIV